MANVTPPTLVVPSISLRGTQGVQLIDGAQYKPIPSFKPELSKTCRLSIWSPDGRYFAWANGVKVSVLDLTLGTVLAEFAKPKTLGLQFSPKNNFFVTWEPYQVTKEVPANTPNVHIWSLSDNNKQSIKSYVQKNHTRWAPEWSADEKLLARNLNQEVQVYETANMEAISQKVQDAKVADFSLSPSTAPYYFLCYIPGSKGQPSFAKLFKYPTLTQAGLIASKSFFLGDKVEMKWNRPGTCVLLMTSTDVDTSGASYYGKQSLHLLDVKGNSSMVQLAKEGPIYNVEWNPQGSEFCAVYGFMPAKATLYDLKGDPKFDFGTGPRNSAFYNRFGNLLLLGGFGNIRGKIEVWDVKALRMVTPMEAPDTTYLQWSPDGQHFMTSTTAPRLRVGNGFKIWHYSGSLIHEQSVESPNELWEASYQPFPDGVYQEFSISTKKVTGIKSSQPQVSKELYRPPGARGTSAILKCLEEREAPSRPKTQQELLGMTENLQKQKKKQKPKNPRVEQPIDRVQLSAQQGSTEAMPSGNREPEKQRKDLQKKLDQIARLKAEQSAGKTLDRNQLEKLRKEGEFRKQLEDLTLQDN